MTNRQRVKPAKPMTAAERRAKDFARVSLQPEASALAANADVMVELAERPDAAAGKRGNVERARRMDAFVALKSSMERLPGAFDAARRLEADILTRRGEDDSGRSDVRIDGAGRDRTDKMIEAGRRADRALGMIGDADAWLLVELIAPSAPACLSATTWRGIVEYVTGETFPHGQSAAVRRACVNLAAAYRKVDEPPRRAA